VIHIKLPLVKSGEFAFRMTSEEQEAKTTKY